MSEGYNLLKLKTNRKVKPIWFNSMRLVGKRTLAVGTHANRTW